MDYKSLIDQDATRLTTWWDVRTRRIRDWLRLEQLGDTELGREDRDRLRGDESNREKMVTNDPTTMISLGVSLLSGQPPVHRVVVNTTSQSDFKKSGQSEHALTGWWREVDDERFLEGRDAFLRELYYWMLATGWHSGVYAMVPDKEGNPRPLAELHNPLEAFQEYGMGGLVTYVHRYYTTLSVARAKAAQWGNYDNLYGDGNQRVRVTDWWKCEYGTDGPEVLNAVICEGMSTSGPSSRLWLKLPTSWGTFMPVLSGPVAGNPDRGAYADDDRWKSTMGKSVLEQNRLVYQQFNRYLSLLAQVAKDHAEPAWLAKGTGLLVDDKDVKGGRDNNGLWTPGGKVISTLNPNASLQRVDPGRSPIEVQQFMQVLQGMMERGGLPYLLYGGSGSSLSGFAINQLLNAAQQRLGPYKLAGERVLKFIDKVWLEDYRREYGDRVITVAGRNLQNGRHGGYFTEEFKSTNIPKYLVTEVETNLALPNDLVSRIAIVRQAIPDGPILDLLTALDEVLKVEDPNLVLERLDQDATRSFRNPIVNQINMVGELKQRANDLRAMGGKDNLETAALLDEFSEYVKNSLAQQGVIKGKAPSSATSGFAPEVQNAAAQGISPDMTRAVLRQSPGTPNAGRAEQLANMGVMG